MAEQPAPGAAGTARKFRCPLCSEPVMENHCPSGDCKWYECKSPTCGAVLNYGGGIGYVLDPKRGMDRKTNSVRRVRVHYRGGVWIDRDSA